MKFSYNSFMGRITGCFKSAWPGALKTALWMIKIMLPVSLAMMLLQYFNILKYISDYLTPLFLNIGLPGESALVFITSVFLNIYAAIAVIGTLTLNMREITILAIMCLISHNLVVETTVQKKTGSSAIRMIIMRISFSFIAAILFNYFLPALQADRMVTSKAADYGNILNLLKVWFNDSVLLSIKVILIVILLMFLQRILEDFNIMKILSGILNPLMKPMGLSEKTSFQWIIANVIGLTYGSAIIIEQVESGNISKKDADFLNHHIGICHSLLEDTILFVSIGAPALWIFFPRIILAMVSVWFYRFEKYLCSKRRSYRSHK